MNKVTCIAVLACFFSLPSVSIAQKNTGIEKGGVYLSPEIGMFKVLNKSHAYLAVPHISASVDIALSNHFTVAPYVGYTVVENDDITYQYRRYTHYMVGSKTEYHFHLTSKLSGYTGIILGLDLTKGADEVHNPNAYIVFTEPPHKVFINIVAGAKLELSKHIAAFAELGYYITVLNVGLSWKLK